MKTIHKLINTLMSDDYTGSGAVDWANTYGEPGYQNSEKGIIFANWNDFDDRIPSLLERAGYSTEWSDEWMIDDNGCKAYRTSPNSHGWVCQVKACDGYWLTPDDPIEDWIEECESTDCNELHSALPGWITEDELIEEGWTKYNGTYESGFHPGQNDDPAKIYQEIEEQVDHVLGVVFRINSTGQFDCHFEAYFKAYIAPEHLR